MKKEDLKDTALGYLQDHLADSEDLRNLQETLLRAYNGRAVGIDGVELDKIEGRSQVEMTDVFDTIEWMMPGLMRVFTGGTNWVEIIPQNADDEVKAKFMQELVNFQFQRQLGKNDGLQNGFTVLHDWFKDALLNKIGIVKYWWMEEEEKVFEEYEDLNENDYQALYDDEAFEIEKQEQVVVQEAILDPLGALISPEIVTWSVEGTRTRDISKPVCCNVPPEEFICNLDMRSVADADFMAHRKRVHKSYLKKYGLDEEEVASTVASWDSDEIKDVRFEDLGGTYFVQDDDDSDYVYIYECYFNDYDEKGNKKPMKVTVFGARELESVENTYGKPPFCILTAIKLPHRAIGRSIGELAIDMQKVNTALSRSILDNIYYQNNGVKVVNPYRLEMDDVIDHNHPGGVWRTAFDTAPSQAIFPVPVQPLAPQTFEMLQWAQNTKESRTGITRYNQGMDSKSLNKTATGISQIMGAAQQREELVARIFSETGVKDLFQAFVDMNIEYFNQETALRLNEGWVNVSPDMIDGKFDILIDVGVGSGSNEIKTNQLMNMLNVSMPAVQMGVVTPQNYAEILISIYELMGFKGAESKFVTTQQFPVPPEVMNQVLQVLGQQGVDVDGIIQQLTQAQEQGGAVGPGERGQLPAQPLPN